jgi:hypothetical protein
MAAAIHSFVLRGFDSQQFVQCGSHSRWDFRECDSSGSDDGGRSEIDRSSNLSDLERQLKRAVEEATRGSGTETKIELMGDRPSGTTPADSEIVQAALEVTRDLVSIPSRISDRLMQTSLSRWGWPAIALAGEVIPAMCTLLKNGLIRQTGIREFRGCWH